MPTMRPKTGYLVTGLGPGGDIYLKKKKKNIYIIKKNNKKTCVCEKYIYDP